MAAVSCHVDKKMTSQPSTREENVLSVQRAAVMQSGGKEGHLGPQELWCWLLRPSWRPDFRVPNTLPILTTKPVLSRLPQSAFHSCNRSPRAHPEMPSYLPCVHSSGVTGSRDESLSSEQEKVPGDLSGHQSLSPCLVASLETP